MHAQQAGRLSRPTAGAFASPAASTPPTTPTLPTPAHHPPQLCHATEHARIAFGKSGIHGWGLFARAPMKQDSMVTEYRCVAFLPRCCIMSGVVAWAPLKQGSLVTEYRCAALCARGVWHSCAWQHSSGLCVFAAFPCVTTSLGQQTRRAVFQLATLPRRGELLRASVAEGRERRYRAQVGCLLSLLAMCCPPCPSQAAVQQGASPCWMKRWCW